MRIRGLGLVVVLAACSSSGEASAPAGSSGGAAEVVRGRGAWEAVAAAPAAPADRQALRGLAVGREALVLHPGSGWLASYDPCERAWQRHDALPQGLRGVSPIALGDSFAAYCCGPPDRSGVLVDVRAAGLAAIAPMPSTPNPGRPGREIADGFMIPVDRRYSLRSRAWRVIGFDAAVYEATGRQGSAVTSSDAHVFVWGGEVFDPRGGAVMSAGGAVFDAARDAWRPTARAGAPSPRKDAAAIWTGRDFLVFGGVGPGGVQLADGGRYDPAADRWQAVVDGPPLAGQPAATLAGDTVLVWDAERGGALDVRTNRWRGFTLPARVSVQDRPHGHGRLAVVTATEAFVLDPRRLEWVRTELPAALHRRDQRVQVMTATHLVVLGGQRAVRSGGCEDPPPGQGCDPWVETAALFDGAALRLASCR